MSTTQSPAKRTMALANMAEQRDDQGLSYLTYKLDLIKTLATKAANPAYEQACGLRVRELRLLRMVHDHPGLPATELKHKLVLDKTLLSKNLSALEQRGLIERTPDERDSRLLRLSLSAEGQRVWLKCEHIGRRLEAEMFGRLCADDWTRLHALIDDATASLLHWLAEHEERPAAA